MVGPDSVLGWAGTRPFSSAEADRLQQVARFAAAPLAALAARAALTTLLENQDMEVMSATNGRQAIELINETPDLGVVLMDIMMPEMDGYETMATIRKDPQFRRLPIIALTAKAMKGDREKCLEAGASDYIAKPVDTDQLLSLLRVWLHR